MDKNTYYETVKNMAVEKVLNQYCSDSDPSRPALKSCWRICSTGLCCLNAKSIS